MKIIIVGIGKIGRIVTEYLANEGHDIVVVDIDAAIVREAVDTYDAVSYTHLDVYKRQQYDHLHVFR